MVISRTQGYRWLSVDVCLRFRVVPCGTARVQTNRKHEKYMYCLVHTTRRKNDSANCSMQKSSMSPFVLTIAYFCFNCSQQPMRFRTAPYYVDPYICICSADTHVSARLWGRPTVRYRATSSEHMLCGPHGACAFFDDL